MQFEIFQREDGQFYFKGLLRNKVVLTSNGYNTKRGAEKGAESVKSSLQRGKDAISKKSTNNGKQYFNALSNEGEEIATSVLYESESERDRIINRIT